MSQIGLLKDFGKTYTNTELINSNIINDLCFKLYRKGKINWPLYVSQPMTLPELEDLLAYNTTNIDKKEELKDEDSFHSFELEDQQQTVKSFLDGWFGYEKKKMSKLINLAESLEKGQNVGMSINWLKILSLSTTIVGSIAAWGYCEYREIPF